MHYPPKLLNAISRENHKKNIFSCQNAFFPRKRILAKSVFSCQKHIFLPKSAKTFFLAKTKNCIFLSKLQKKICFLPKTYFPAKNAFSRQNQKLYFRVNIEKSRFPVKIKKISFSRQNRKISFFAKTEVIVSLLLILFLV